MYDRGLIKEFGGPFCKYIDEDEMKASSIEN